MRLLLCASLTAACGRATATSSPAPSETAMHPTLVRSLEQLLPRVDELAAERREPLDDLAEFVRTRRSKGAPARLTFICTGNSRRSHLGQLWAAAAARYLEIDGVETYSGGTEPSAFNPRTIAALERAGFVVESPEHGGENPHYLVRYGDDAEAIESFSKRFDDAINPRSDFAAVMTCSEADQECPLVPGAALRVSLPYDDPKAADDTPDEAARYDERSRQIATEMLYLFSRVAGS
jgi:arsenate reductase